MHMQKRALNMAAMTGSACPLLIWSVRVPKQGLPLSCDAPGEDLWALADKTGYGL
jgi:hypothetical protein